MKTGSACQGTVARCPGGSKTVKTGGAGGFCGWESGSEQEGRPVGRTETASGPWGPVVLFDPSDAGLVYSFSE